MTARASCLGMAALAALLGGCGPNGGGPSGPTPDADREPALEAPPGTEDAAEQGAEPLGAARSEAPPNA